MKLKPDRVERNLERRDIVPFLIDQKYDIFSYPRPDILFMDSFSELTDQCFRNRQQKWCFYAHYSDIRHSDEFDREYESLGLLPVEDLFSMYQAFFEKVAKVFPGVPVIFLHYPVELEAREKFRHRGQKIKEIVENLCSRHGMLHSVSVDESLVARPENCIDELKDFPYHYNGLTYGDLVGKISRLGLV
ncbi:MAG: hypothetical protein KKE17_01505 [Proteobacteria bacterium]|nr:hypothetical protein [Pseudomonadota bacterium]MBU1708657.1 hypothetical protein [Pseudomonadota bacterium]